MLKAFVKTEKHGVRCWTADVVSEQDYHQRGPMAHSFRTGPRELPTNARKEAEDWAHQNGYLVVPVEEI
jgi:hypothetical protein